MQRGDICQRLCRQRKHDFHGSFTLNSICSCGHHRPLQSARYKGFVDHDVSELQLTESQSVAGAMGVATCTWQQAFESIQAVHALDAQYVKVCAVCSHLAGAPPSPADSC